MSKKNCNFISEKTIDMKTLCKNTLWQIASITLLCLFMGSCSGGIAGNGNYDGDTVVVKTTKLSDTTSFVKNNGERCAVYANASIDVPVKFGDNHALGDLRKLFAQHLLLASDSLSLDEALAQSTSITLEQYNFDSNTPREDIGEEELMSEDVKSYTDNITITVSFNKYNIVTFSKVEVVKKDDKVTSVTHKYFNFDLETMTLIDLNNLFREECNSVLCNNIKSQLMKDNNVSSEEQLSELGFYNIDNLSVTHNFSFGNNGITWTYLPNELSVETLGEPTVTLDYEALIPYASEKSVIKRIQ